MAINEGEPLVIKPAVQGDRVTLQTNFYFEHQGEQPLQFSQVFSERLKGAEESYTRRVKVTEEGAPLDLSYLKDDVGWVIVQSLEGEIRTVQPTEEERADRAKRIISVYFGAERGLHIHPGQMQIFRTCPEDAQRIRLISQHGTIPCRVHLFPR